MKIGRFDERRGIGWLCVAFDDVFWFGRICNMGFS